MAEEDIIIMKQRELKRLHIVRKILEKTVKQVEAASLLDLSGRQIRRVVARVKEEGNKGIIHKSRGQPSNRKLPDSLKNKVIKLYRTRYKGFGPILANEKLFEIDKIKIGDQTLRNWLMQAGLWGAIRKRRKYRQWRERKHYFGEMIQVDGSHHDWFEGRGPKCVLMGYIDDATNICVARFYTYEGTMPAFDSLKRYIKRYGLPRSLYLDKHTTYKSNGKLTVEDELNNREKLSQLERAAKELGIDIIHANSPQAKGRIERVFKTYQDRLIKEMRLRNISTIKEANRFLGSFIPKHNRRFSIKPIKEGDLHRPLPKNIALDTMLCIKEQRILRNDFTILYNKELYQVLDKWAGKVIQVQERINGSIQLYYKDRKLSYKLILTKYKQDKTKPKPRIIIRPKMEHPWKKASYDRMVLEKGKNPNKELVLTNV